jgi:hypothetical protein
MSCWRSSAFSATRFVRDRIRYLAASAASVTTHELGLRKPWIASRMPRAQLAILVFTATWLLANVISCILIGVGESKSQHEAYLTSIGGLICHSKICGPRAASARQFRGMPGVASTPYGSQNGVPLEIKTQLPRRGDEQNPTDRATSTHRSHSNPAARAAIRSAMPIDPGSNILPVVTQPVLKVRRISRRKTREKCLGIGFGPMETAAGA